MTVDEGPGEQTSSPVTLCVNEFAGSVDGPVLQVGTLHGGVHFRREREPLVPRQLPPAPKPFTGRDSELAGITTAVDEAAEADATMVISAIGGLAGVSKTCLALQWAHRNADRFPDGQLFVDLRGFSPTEKPVQPAEAVRGFLDALGVTPDKIPVDPEARTGRYRSLVADRRMLIVLDNARDTDQVTPLLPGSPNRTVLVTSRRYLSGLVASHAAKPVVLNPLTDAEAHQLLGPAWVLNGCLPNPTR